LEQRRKSLLLLELPADSTCDLGEPSAEGDGLAELIEMAIGLEQGLDQNVFRIFPIAAYANHLAIHHIFVFIGEPFEIHVVIFSSAGWELNA
jgi:hypothetical protein